MALTPEEAATLAALQAKAAEDEGAAETAGEVAAEVGAAVAEAVADVAETVAAVVAHEVGQAHEDAGDLAAVEVIAEQVADAAEQATEAADLAAGAAVAAILAVEDAGAPVVEGAPFPEADEPAVEVEVMDSEGAAVEVVVSPDDAPAEHGATTHPWFRPRTPWWRRLGGSS